MFRYLIVVFLLCGCAKVDLFDDVDFSIYGRRVSADKYVKPAIRYWKLHLGRKARYALTHGVYHSSRCVREHADSQHSVGVYVRKKRWSETEEGNYMGNLVVNAFICVSSELPMGSPAFWKTLLHEMGHAFYQPHSHNPDHIMYPGDVD